MKNFKYLKLLKIGKMNKKGIVWYIPLIIIAGLALIGIGFGWWTSYKINETIQSIPTWLWIVGGIFLILLILPKKK